MVKPLGTRMHIAIILALLVSACVLSSCSKPRYLLRGLTLPRGSTEVASDDRGETETELWTSSDLHVEFDNDKGWGFVRDHFDRQMARAGFEITDYAKDSSGDPELDEWARSMGDTMRLYVHPFTSSWVMITNQSAFAAQSKQFSPKFGNLQFGEFVLDVAIVK